MNYIHTFFYTIYSSKNNIPLTLCKSHSRVWVIKDIVDSYYIYNLNLLISVISCINVKYYSFILQIFLHHLPRFFFPPSCSWPTLCPLSAPAMPGSFIAGSGRAHMIITVILFLLVVAFLLTILFLSGDFTGFFVLVLIAPLALIFLVLVFLAVFARIYSAVTPAAGNTNVEEITDDEEALARDRLQLGPSRLVPAGGHESGA